MSEERAELPPCLDSRGHEWWPSGNDPGTLSNKCSRCLHVLPHLQGKAQIVSEDAPVESLPITSVYPEHE